MAKEWVAHRGYHDVARPELLDLIPLTAQKILDLGCANGELGAAVKRRQNCEITGIELNKAAAAIAEKQLDRVYIDNLNRFDPTFLNDKYDCIILADILEHLIAPWTVLEKFAKVLTTGGVLIASIPNIAHPEIIQELQEGLFRYRFAGLLDIGHLRFFTKTSIFQLFYRAKLKIINCTLHPSNEQPQSYLITAVKPAHQYREAVATILILTCNAWKHTQMCINSIKQKTHVPYKILAIDNGSTDETVKELRRDRQVYHIENSCNLGFAKGFNIGLTLIDTPYFVLANSDVIVTESWLACMIENISQDKDLTILGPRSNHVSGPQLIKDVAYKDAKGLEAFAVSRLKDIKEPLTYHNRICFFFTLFKTISLGKVGFLDEQFGKGNFEDDDYCLRNHLAKAKSAYDNTVFIHHWGNRTFQANKISHSDLMKENKEKFMKKWNLKEYNPFRPS